MRNDPHEFVEEPVNDANAVPAWKEYEGQIVDKFQREFPDEEILADTKVPGYFSKTERQVDVLIKGMMGGHRIFGVVECKCFNKKVDVKVVDSFVGFLQDVKANLGVIITNNGFTEAASNRAEANSIRLDIVEFEHLEEYHYEPDLCDACADADHSPGFLFFIREHQPIEIMDLDNFVELTDCERCGTYHVKCLTCDTITAVYEHEYDDPKECEGGCGLVFSVDEEHDSDAIAAYFS